ncbi:hypothetical protein RvY_00021 [Ramazzottius varieornatus]|uniref:Uncharacterized protein n=1 Tax=Ramazzottius varieornatus TaxID=947166 RepID=A0A1D1UB68_RAMVA|nr:hypothetical protein RvY_00021 [Ramazzottius varieornatus]
MGADEPEAAAGISKGRQRFRFISLPALPSLPSLSLAPLRQRLSQFLNLVRFVLSSSNEMVAYHRQVVGAAALPFLFAMGTLLAYSSGYIHTLFMRRAIQFIFMICTVYSTDIIRTKLLPRQKTYEKWCSYMSSLKHNPHACAVLLAFHMQMQHGDAPPGLWPEDVKLKYVNFCWRYTYRLWLNKLNMLAAKRDPSSGSSSSSDSTLAEKDSAMSLLHQSHPVEEAALDGDLPSMQAARRLLEPAEYLKLDVLDKLAGRVRQYARVLAGSARQKSQHDHHYMESSMGGDDPMLTKLKVRMMAAHDHEHAS